MFLLLATGEPSCRDNVHHGFPHNRNKTFMTFGPKEEDEGSHVGRSHTPSVTPAETPHITGLRLKKRSVLLEVI